MMRNHFFHLLPSDLHLHILQSWVGDAKAVMLTLSSLDIACSQTALRPALLEFMASLMPIGSDNDPVPISDLLGCFAWLDRRKPRVASIRLSRHLKHAKPLKDWQLLEDIALTHIMHVVVPILGKDERLLTLLLRACPNIITLKVYNHMDEYPYKNSCPFAWLTIASLNLQLKSLSLPFRDASYQHQEMSLCLRTVGPYLKTLSLEAVALSDVISDLLCMSLECLTINGSGVLTASVVELLQQSKTLKELTLTDCSRSEVDIDGILTAGMGQLTVLKVHVTGNKNIGLSTFAAMLEKHSWLQHLRLQNEDSLMNHNAYDRLAGSLVISVPDIDEVDEARLNLKQICAGCSKLVKLSTQWLPNEHIAMLFGDSFGKDLLELSVPGCSPGVLQSIFIRCPKLARLQLSDNISDQHLHMITEHCKHLTCLVVLGPRHWGSDFLTDAGLEQVLTCCTMLKELTLDCNARLVTFQTLQTILDKHIQLSKFDCKRMRLIRAEVNTFRLLARKQQLVPVPLVTVPKTNLRIVCMLGRR